MLKIPSIVEQFRDKRPGGRLWDSDPGDPCGAFTIKRLFIERVVGRPQTHDLQVLVTDGRLDLEGGVPPEIAALPRWEHLSVSGVNYGLGGTIKLRIPTWEDMCFLKDLFWDAEDAVVQYHPPRSVYVNDCQYVLHLWRPLDEALPLPPTIFVGRHPNDEELLSKFGVKVNTNA